MDVWGRPAVIGIAFGLVVFAVTFFPIVAVQYRRYGRFTVLRLLGAAAVSVSSTTLLAYTLVPLPDSTSKVCAPTLELVPFHSVGDILTDTAGDGLVATLTSAAMLQVVFNVLLFVPLGIIVRGFFGRGLATTVLAGFAASVLIESTQYTALWGVYSCAYRVADVDDVITNTLGALVGALLGPWLLRWMPRERALAAARSTPRPVTVWRRWLGMAIDLALFTVIGGVLTVPYALVVVALGGTALRSTDPVSAALGSIVPALLVFVLPALRHTGASLGQSAVWLRPHWARPASAPRRLARAASVGGLYGVLVFVSRLDVPGASLVGGLGTLLLVAAFVAVPLSHGRGLSALVSGAVVRDERDPATPEPVEATTPR